MRLNWIIIGLVILIPITKIDIIPDFLGYLSIILGLYNIRTINKKYYLALFPILLLLINSLLTFINNILYFFNIHNTIILKIYDNNTLSIIFKLFEGRYSLIYGVFALLFYIGIEEQAKILGYNALSKQARNLLFIILFFLAITTIPYIQVLPFIIYQILIYIITFLEILVIYTYYKIFIK